MFRKKYENYKKLSLQEKTELDMKTKELQLLKDKMEPTSEFRELKVKYENLKILH